MDLSTQTVIAALVGLALGFLVSLINGFVSRRALQKGSSAALTVMVVCRMTLDLIVLGGLFLFRNTIPLPFTPTLLGAATGLALGGILSAAMLDRQMKKQAESKTKKE
jgi:CHASE2 domain-containing sensor protein